MSDASSSIDSAAQESAAGFAAARAVLKPRKARPFYGRHPWVLDSAIARIEGSAADGDVVDLLADTGKFIARGLYNSQSRIRVRLYTWDVGQALDDNLWRKRIETALALRSSLALDAPQGAARLVYSEADGLSGLIVDRYAQWLAVQLTGLGMARRLDELVAILRDAVAPRGIFIRTEKGVARAEGIELRDGLYWGEGPEGPVFIEENGLRYGVDLAEGQKTGFYLDQRDNRRVAAGYFRKRRVLDMFCYSGAFSLNAAVHGGAREVLGFDTSAKAVALARANAELNGVSNVHFEAGDGFDVLQSLAASGERFGAVVLDPPKFARRRSSVDDALRAYHRLNRLAADVLEPGGILVTCSCSGHVTREDFLFMLLGVAEQTGREIQVLEMRGAAADHPLAVTCLEGEYLKCFICRVI
ncbi:MAG: class I SAM-dependent rRNA methyltransferase [Planctomycetota bacterium]|nr:MAG: class I SAM-dependent rRNA methyltransferase [Planctomycetota bacterium]